MAYGEIIPDTPVAIALLKVTAKSPNSLTAQTILVHPQNKIRSGLSLDNRLEYYSTSELLPANERAVGYLLQDDQVRLRPYRKLQTGDQLMLLKPDIVDGAVIDYSDTGNVMQERGIEQLGAVATVGLVEGIWLEKGTLARVLTPTALTTDQSVPQ